MPAPPPDEPPPDPAGAPPSSGADGLALLLETIRARVTDHFGAGRTPQEAVAALALELPIDAHDQYPAWHHAYPFRPLVRAHLWRLANGWDSHPRLRRALQRDPVFLGRLGFQRLPNQATLWRAWHHRFSPPLRAALRDAAAAVAAAAADHGHELPGPPATDDTAAGAGRDGRLAMPVLENAQAVSEHVQHLVYPALDLQRHHNTAIPERAFWSLQTYLGMHEDLHANGGAELYAHDSTRKVTPLGDIHRDHIRALGVETIRAQYQAAVANTVQAARGEGRLARPVTVAIDMTTSWPYTGCIAETDGVFGTKEATNEYAFHWATIQIVDADPPLVLDVHPVQPGFDLGEIVATLLDNALEHVAVEVVLMDREFDADSVKQACEARGVYYLNQRRMHTSQQAQADRLAAREARCYVDERTTVGAGPTRKEVYVPRYGHGPARGLTAADSDTDATTTEPVGRQASLWDELDDTLAVDVAGPGDAEQAPFADLGSDIFDEGVLGDRDGEADDDGPAYVVFETNHPAIDTTATGSELLHSVARVVRRYRLRWRIENAYYNIKRLMAKTTSRDFGLRYFYFAFASLLYNVWKLADLLLRVELDLTVDGPVVSFALVAGFVRRETGVG